jgi:hypothetical protein
MKRLGVLVLALVIFAACDKKTRPGSQSPPRDSTASLWALAPPRSPGGLVIGDGVPTRAVELGAALWKLVAERPWTKPYLDEARAEMQRELPFDILDPAAWKASGFDLSKGFAIFAADDGREPALMVLPVGDRAAFRKTVKATSENQGGREVDRLESDVLCATAGDRYLCATKLEHIDEAVKAHDSTLATAMKGLAKDKRGDAEFYVDMTRMPNPDGALPSTLWGSLRFGDDGLTSHLWMKGPELAPAAMFLSRNPPSADMKQHTGRAGMVMRVALQMDKIAATLPPMEPVGAIDVKRDVVDQLTGEIQIVTTSDAKLGGIVLFGLKDGGPLAKALQHGCELAKAAVASEKDVKVTIDFAGGACTADVEMKELAAPGFDRLRLRAAVEGKLASVAFGDVDLKSFAGSADKDAGSNEAKDALAGPYATVWWMRGFDFSSGLPPALMGQLVGLEPKVANAVDMASWLGAHLYEIAMASGFENDTMHVLVRVTTVGADPPEARKAYGEALRKRFAGDTSGWQAAIADLQKQHPESVAARMSSASGGTAFVVGMMAAIAIPAFVKYIEMSKQAVPPEPPPPPQ